MFNRRDFLGQIPVSSVVFLTGAACAEAAPTESKTKAAPPKEKADLPLLASPPVVQHPAADGFSVSFAVSRLAMGWIEWGLTADRLDRKAVASFRGLIEASDHALVVPVALGDRAGGGRRVYYRVVAQPLIYRDAYHLEQGKPVAGPVRSVAMIDPASAKASVAVVNDTHDHVGTLASLASRLDTIAPQLLVWNGDTCNSLSTADAPARTLLQPGADPKDASQGGWASTRPLLFVPGNHDSRGIAARELRTCLAPWPEASMPYNFALRHGPLALIGLDTGEDKPDAHPVFAGTAAYEPYRAKQAQWLRQALARPEIAAAPFKAAFCHIPLRGRPNEDDGLSLADFARWSGDGARHWMPILREAGVNLLVCAHAHAWRVDDPADGLPMQVVGGGPTAKEATIIQIEADSAALTVVVQNLKGQELARRKLTRS
jgi:hypothetical protein